MNLGYRIQYSLAVIVCISTSFLYYHCKKLFIILNKTKLTALKLSIANKLLEGVQQAGYLYPVIA